MNITKRKKNSIISIFAKYSFIFIIAFVLVAPVLATPCTYVDQNDPSQNIPLNCNPDEQSGSTSTNNPPAGSTSTNTGGVNINTGIVNPIGGVEDIPQFIETIFPYCWYTDCGNCYYLLRISFCYSPRQFREANKS